MGFKVIQNGTVRSHMTSYQPAYYSTTVSRPIALACTIFEIFDKLRYLYRSCARTKNNQIGCLCRLPRVRTEDNTVQNLVINR